MREKVFFNGQDARCPSGGEFNGQDARCPSEGEFNGQDARCPSEGEFNGQDARCPSGDEFNGQDARGIELMAAELPKEYEGAWIAKVVQSFGGARHVEWHVLDDLFQVACEAAAKAVAEAEARGGDTTAFVKTAVRHALSKANRRFDSFTAHVEYAEDGARMPDADPDERLVELVPDTKYRPSRQRKVDAVRLAALLVSPPVQAYWRAFRATGGSETDIAKRLGVYRQHVHCVLAPRARAEFAEALRWVGLVRGGAR